MKYLIAYSDEIQSKVRLLIDENKLGNLLL